MTRRLTGVILIMGFSLAMSSDAYAQLKDNLELNLFGAGSWYSSNKYEVSFPQAVSPIQGEFKFNRGFKGGLRLGVFTRGHWSEEFYYSYEPQIAHFRRISAPSSSLDLDLQVHNYGISALYYIHEDEAKKVRPFLSIGIGGTLYRLTPEASAFVRDPLRGNVPDMDNSHELGMNYGFGVKSTRSAGWLGFRFDLRGFVGRHPSFGLARQSNDPNATVFPATGVIHNGEASAGLIFYFGKR